MQYAAILATIVTLSPATASVLNARAINGQASYYGGNVAGGTCSFSTYTLPAGIMGTALGGADWDNSAKCGACVSVKGPNGNAVTAMIVDQCPECKTGHLDLFSDAFAGLTDPSKGIIDITWDYVECSITTPLVLHNKEGVSPYWFSMQVVNANQAVSKLEVSTDGGSTWQATVRQTYNFFEASSGYGTATVSVRVTAADGSTVIVHDVSVSSGASVTASSNFQSSYNARVEAKDNHPKSSAAPSSATPTEYVISAIPQTTPAVPKKSVPASPSASSSAPSSPSKTASNPGQVFHETPSSSVVASSSSAPILVAPPTSSPASKAVVEILTVTVTSCLTSASAAPSSPAPPFPSAPPSSRSSSKSSRSPIPTTSIVIATQPLSVAPSSAPPAASPSPSRTTSSTPVQVTVNAAVARAGSLGSVVGGLMVFAALI